MIGTGKGEHWALDSFPFPQQKCFSGLWVELQLLWQLSFGPVRAV